jgi:solute carrier family 25 oxoglutarate transporter 11
MRIMAEGGPLRFYAGFPTFYVRIAPHAMITLIAQDAIKKGWGKFGL